MKKVKVENLSSQLSNQLFLGKLICHPSPVDEEIKKPLVLETLKLALPKKKLNRM